VVGACVPPYLADQVRQGGPESVGLADIMAR
jgi:hypothetical protein